MPQSLVIWTNAKPPPQLMETLLTRLGSHKLVISPAATSFNLLKGEPDPLLEQADVAWGQPDHKQSKNLTRLKWIQLTTAGYTRYDTPEFRAAMKKSGTIVANASSVYSEPCAQHALAMMLALARQIPQSRDNQLSDRAWPYLPLRSQSRLLNGQIVLIVGYGAIGRRIAELLIPFEVKVYGFRRNPNTKWESALVFPVDELDAWLPSADHVINVLPSSRETEMFFNADRFAKIKRSAVYYNLGRGSTTDQYALRAVLETGHIGAAYLDATTPEPLPPDDPLWIMPNCFITPHTAGGHATEFERHVELFLTNLQNFLEGKDILDRIM